ncbi:prolyl aminopeptidase [Methylophilus methylotrophus]|uniref:prolyl aminopeptidase n=1 Tax=Methylophilus methylotrophus TaxID=17 RepID=UPI000F59A41D|nr:prolyl aminopeptidase [Methylophilus methylotrophus]
MTTPSLYPECLPYNQTVMPVTTTHSIYVEECGNPHGMPVIFLHGGPGSGCNPAQRRFFDPDHYRIILFDQRGCGRSQPAGETKENNTQALVGDIETIRHYLQIERWHVFGGSWGSTLALAYANTHPSPVVSLTLRGIFLSRPHEIRWFLGQVALFFPEAWQTLLAPVPTSHRENVLDYYASLVFDEDISISIPAAIRWNAFEASIMSLIPKMDSAEVNGAVELARARVQIHYIQHLCFVDGDEMLQTAAKQLADIPTTIVQGRYDMVCPPQTAWELAQALPHASLVMVPDAGHSAMEPGTCQALMAATEQYKRLAA